MSTIINIVNKADGFFIHEKLKKNLENYGKARVLLYALIATAALSTSYTIYHELSNENIHFIKHIANVVAVLYCPIGMLFLKYNGNIKLILMVILSLATSLVFASTYFCGGIYAVDLFWMVVITMVGLLFIGHKGALLLSVLSLMYILLFYFLELFHVHPFARDNDALGLGYKLYNLFFLLGLASFIAYFFVNGAAKTKKELDALKEKQVKSLDYKFRYIAENANEIIALHNNIGEVIYISPAAKNILGYDVEDLLGSGYSNILNAKVNNGEFVCTAKNGEQKYLEISMRKIKDELGVGDAYISMARDISSKAQENKKIAALRKQIANDFHDEMGNKLAAITLNSNILSMQVQDEPDIRNTIAKIEETSKSLYHHSRDFIWSIDSKSDDLREIFSYLRDFGEDFFHSLPIDFLVESKGFSEQEKIILPMYSGRHIILIFKEVLTNAAKHAQCKSIVLLLKTTNEHFIIEVQDDGKGIDAGAKKGKGLNSMHERAKNIDCTLHIESDGKGTKISLKGKLPNSGSAKEH